MHKDTKIIAALVAADGAIQRWQVPDADAFDTAMARGIIRFDPMTDCYAHLEAVPILGDAERNGYEMPDAALAAWYVGEVGYDPFADAAQAQPPETREGIREMIHDMADWIARGAPDERATGPRRRGEV